MFVLSKHISIKRSRCVRAKNDQHGHPTPSEPRDTRIRNPVILVILVILGISKLSLGSPLKKEIDI